MYPNQYNQLNTNTGLTTNQNLVPTNQNFVPTNQNFVPTNYAVNQITAIPYGQIPLNFHPQNPNGGFPINSMANHNANALNMPQYNPPQYNVPQYNVPQYNPLQYNPSNVNAFQQNAQNMIPQDIQNVNASQQNTVETGDTLDQKVADVLRKGGSWPSYNNGIISIENGGFPESPYVREICKKFLQERGTWTGKPGFETWRPNEIHKELGEKYGEIKNSNDRSHSWFISIPKEDKSGI
jgi:hypothetical protein